MKAGGVYFLVFLLAALVSCAGFSSYLFFDLESFLKFVLLLIFPAVVFTEIIRRAVSKVKLRIYTVDDLALPIIAWVVFLLVDFYMAGAVPLLQIAMGIGSYLDFKPPLHGFTNALSLLIVCLLPFSAVRNKWLLLVGVIFYQISILNRGPALYHLVGYLAGYSAKEIQVGHWKRLVKRLLVLAVIVVLGFSLLGALRSIEENVISDLFGVDPKFGWVPDSMVWVLIYFSSPFSNLMYNISLGDVTCRGGVPALLSSLLPGVIRNNFLDHDPTDGANLPCEVTGELFHPALNVSTGFVQYYIDFGLPGFVFAALVLGVVFARLEKHGVLRWDALSSLIVVLLFVNIFAPSFNQLSFVVTLLLILVFCRRRHGA